MFGLAAPPQNRLQIESRLSRLYDKLFRPVDGAFLAYFRIAFGLIMLWEVVRYFDHGWIARYWIDPVVNFPYYGFGWLRPLPGVGMYLLFAALGVLAILITLGRWYRPSIILFFLGFTYSFLLEQARYLNHFYLIILISFIMIWLPANRVYSLDARRGAVPPADHVPAWTLWLLRFQLGVVYFFAGLAKLNGDWLHGEPMRQWMAARMEFPLIGRFFTEEWMVMGFSYGGMLLDVLVAPLLLWPVTRPFAFAAAVLFHLMNAELFSIGIFPWFMIAATAVFFPPDWPRRVLGWLGCRCARDVNPDRAHTSQRKPLIAALLALFVAAQLLLPLRYTLYAGVPSWTEEGHRYAWRMKLRSKSGSAVFHITDKQSGATRTVDPGDYLPRWQKNKVVVHPHMIWQFARFLAEEERQRGASDVAVTVEAMVSLNGRSRQLLIDPDADLLAQTFSLRPSPWIVPLETPLALEIVAGDE